MEIADSVPGFTDTLQIMINYLLLCNPNPPIDFVFLSLQHWPGPLSTGQDYVS